MLRNPYLDCKRPREFSEFPFLFFGRIVEYSIYIFTGRPKSAFLWLEFMLGVDWNGEGRVGGVGGKREGGGGGGPC